MQGARLDFSALIGGAKRPIPFQSSNLSGVTNDGGALRYVNLTEAIFDTPPDLRNAFGDGSVDRPETIPRPEHWPLHILDDTEFYGRWRGWVEAGREPEIWAEIAPEGFEDVEAIPPEAWVERSVNQG